MESWHDISNWCRVCGNFEGLLSVENDLQQQIMSVLQVIYNFMYIF